MTARRRKTRRLELAQPRDPKPSPAAADRERARDTHGVTWSASPEKIFLVLALTLGVVFVFLTPPFQVPDEPQHFYRAFQVSELGFLAPVALNGREGALLPKSLADLVDSSNVAATRFRPAIKVDPSKFLAALHAPLNAHDRDYLPVSSYPPVAYLPQAVGIGIGRFFGAPPLVLFYLGRLFALGAWTVLVFLAIKITPRLQWTYVLLALMPMTLYLAASISVDSVVIAVSFLLSAHLLSWAYDDTRERIGFNDVVRLLVMAVALSLSKAVYLTAIFLFVLVPQKKFESKTKYFLTFGAIVIACLAAHQGWSVFSHWAMTPGPSIELSRHGVDASHLPDVSPDRQLEFIRANPWAFVNVLLTTVSTPKVLFYYLNSFVGMLGWLDVLLPAWVAYAYVVVVIVVSLLNGSREPVSWKAKGVAFGIFSLTWLITLVYLYVGYSSVGMIVVGGFQGRYLIPIAPLFFLVFQNHHARWRVGHALAIALIGFVALTTAVAGYSMVRRFYVAEVPSYAIEQASLSPAGDVVIIRGWAVDRALDGVAAGVDVEVDGQYYHARYGLDRIDIAERLGKSSYRYSGFEAHIPIAQFGRGRHSLALRILAKDHTSYIVPEQRWMLGYK